jgi:hypothetical protein
MLKFTGEKLQVRKGVRGVGLVRTLLVENRGYGRIVIIILVTIVEGSAQTGSHDEVTVNAGV